MSKITCPKCQSENVQTLSMIYDSGTSTAVHNTSGSSIAVDSGGGIGIGVGSAKTTSTSVSTLAAKVAPPQKKSLKYPFIAVIILLLITMNAFGSSIIGGLVMLLVTAGVGYFIYTRMQWNKTEYPKLLENWQKIWKCHACGHEFIPE